MNWFTQWILVVVYVLGILNPNVVQVDNAHITTAQIKTAGCITNQELPDARCTPGAVLTTDKNIICVSGYTKTVRNVPTTLRDKVFKAYSVPDNMRSNYELDHLISLELGGSNDYANLWPEPYNLTDGAIDKDGFENYLHDQICNGAMSVEEAQKQIATDWIKYDQLRIANESKDKNTVSTSTNNTINTDPQVKKSNSGICHEKGTTYYNRTKHFTPYDTIEDCIKSGGRLPKK